MDKYYKGLEHATIVKYKGMNFGFPVFTVLFADGSVGDIEISSDAEGNGGGFIFGLPTTTH